jgi:hypothetical protein
MCTSVKRSCWEAGRLTPPVHAQWALELALAHGNKRDEPWARLLLARSLAFSRNGER